MNIKVIRISIIILYVLFIQLIVQLLQFYLIGKFYLFKYLNNENPFSFVAIYFIMMVFLSDEYNYKTGYKKIDKKIFRGRDFFILLFTTIIYFGWIAYYTYKYYKN